MSAKFTSPASTAPQSSEARRWLGGLIPASLTPGPQLLAEGAALGRDWRLSPGAFLSHYGVASELAFKAAHMADGVLMQHAQIGFRDRSKTVRAAGEIYERCQKRGATVHRYGVCLDWSMGLPPELRDTMPRGTGLFLSGPEEFRRLSDAAPVALHFGDFVLGFPAALWTTQCALAAGATSVGNLGQYFTFRLPGHDNDVEATLATVRALGLLAAQPVPILIHSNLDDGFAAVFKDLASVLGAVLLEKYIVEDLIGGHMSHCYGHHFSDPVKRVAFHLALAAVSDTPGTMIYGNTTSYRGTPVENYASLAAYLTADIAGQLARPTGHALNPVPVTENERIPDIDEIIDAQLFAHRLAERAGGLQPLVDMGHVQQMADDIVAGGRTFCRAVLEGFEAAGIDTRDAAQLLIALRRLGGKKLETLFQAATTDCAGGRGPIVQSCLVDELDDMARGYLEEIPAQARADIAAAGLRVLSATTDVHEHGKMLLDGVLVSLGVDVRDAGVTVAPDALAEVAKNVAPDVIAISTYNGIALAYTQALTSALAARGLQVPIMIGGRLNQIPEGSNTSLPVDVGERITATGAIACRTLSDAFDVLHRSAKEQTTR